MYIELINSPIKPETNLEREIVSDIDFIEGAMWGKPRNGHPEGEVIYHIGEVLDNVNKMSNMHNRAELRLIAIIHDTFKNKVDQTKSKTGENHHAMIARRFAEKYISDQHILDIIELHDEAYNSWCKGARDGKWDKAEARAISLIKRIDSYMPLYLTFFECDSFTGDKATDSVKWFIEIYSNNK